MTATKEQLQQAFGVVAALAEAVRAAGEIPSGHLYAAVMDKLTYEDYQTVIRTLKNAKLVSEQAHLLRWIGPTFDADGRKER